MSPPPLTPEDLTDEYVAATAVAAYGVARTIAAAYRAFYEGEVAAADLEPITLSAADAIALAAYVGVCNVLIRGEL